MRVNRAVITTLALAAIGLVASAQQPSTRFDLLIRGGTVIDGTGRAPYRGDVGVVGRHIARIGDLASADAATIIDASGLSVAPGFINIHSHAAPKALGTAENMLAQGVTLEIVNADGSGPPEIAKPLATIASAGLAVNVGANIGFNAVWAHVVGLSDRRPRPAELAAMRDLLVAGLEYGAWGVSAGLDYKPAYFATTEEVIDVVRAAAPFRTIFTNHDRVTPESNYSSRVGMNETMTIGARAGLIPVITHMKLQGREQGTAAAFLKTMSDATAQGRYTAADAYPYLAGQTTLAALIIPGWAQDGGREAMLERFKDPAVRAKIVAEAETAIVARFGGADSIYMPSLERGIPDVMKELGVSPGEAVVRVLEQGNVGMIARFGLEDDLVKILQHPTTSIACDCGAALPGTATHPRFYGTYPRVLGRYVRETKSLTLTDAIRKMTLLPAATIGLIDRGAIAVGMAADITIFDPQTVIDRATFEQPTLDSVGIRHVIVNGVIALRDGVATGRQGGEVLLRRKYMPSRQLEVPRARRVVVSMPAVGPDTGYWFDVDLTQSASASRATGKLRALSPPLRSVGAADAVEAARVAFDGFEFGTLQVTGNWATVSGRVYAGPRREERNVVVVIDGAEATSRAPVVYLRVDGSPEPPATALHGATVRIQ